MTSSMSAVKNKWHKDIKSYQGANVAIIFKKVSEVGTCEQKLKDMRIQAM